MFLLGFRPLYFGKKLKSGYLKKKIEKKCFCGLGGSGTSGTLGFNAYGSSSLGCGVYDPAHGGQTGFQDKTEGAWRLRGGTDGARWRLQNEMKGAERLQT